MSFKSVLVNLILALSTVNASALVVPEPPIPPYAVVSLDYTQVTDVSELAVLGTVGGQSGIFVSIKGYRATGPGLSPLIEEQASFKLRSDDQSEACTSRAKFAQAHHLPFFIEGDAEATPGAFGQVHYTRVTFCAVADPTPQPLAQ